MRRGILLVLLLGIVATACESKGKTYKGGTDPLPVETPPSGGAARFAAVHAIFQRTCVNCHSNFASWTESEFLAAPNGLVVARNSAGSLIYQRLKGSGFGSATMPQAGQWSVTDLAKFQDWIDKIGTDPNPTPSPSPSPSPSGGPSASQRRASAFSALQVNGCMGCHTATKTATSGAYSGATVPAFGNYTTDMDFVTAGMILPGNASDSWLYRVLRGYGNIGSMPITGGTPTTPEGNAIRDWIDNLANP